MATMNISLTAELKEFVERRVAEGAYTSTSEYMRELVRNERDKQRLRDLILEGANSPPVDLSREELFEKMYTLTNGE